MIPLYFKIEILPNVLRGGRCALKGGVLFIGWSDMIEHFILLPLARNSCGVFNCTDFN